MVYQIRVTCTFYHLNLNPDIQSRKPEFKKLDFGDILMGVLLHCDFSILIFFLFFAMD